MEALSATDRRRYIAEKLNRDLYIIMNAEARDWVINEDAKCRKVRIANLEWLINNTPNSEYWIFHGGPIAKYLFEEAKYCFVYSQFLATIILGFAFIEHTLAAMFFASGRNDLERLMFQKY